MQIDSRLKHPRGSCSCNCGVLYTWLPLFYSGDVRRKLLSSYKNFMPKQSRHVSGEGGGGRNIIKMGPLGWCPRYILLSIKIGKKITILKKYGVCARHSPSAAI